MTVAALSSKKDYLENGTTLTFAIPFRFLSGAIALNRVLPDGTIIVLQPGTDYSIAGGATDDGGSLTLVSSVAGARLRIRRQTDRAQQAQYTNSDRFPAASHEGALDRQMMIAQEQDDDLRRTEARALMVPDGETAPGFPSKNERAGKFFVGLPDGSIGGASGTGNDPALRQDIAASGGGDLINTKPVGVVGDGAVNDRLALQSAFNVKRALGLPRSSYLVIGQILAAALMLQGNGSDETVIRQGNNAGIVLNVPQSNDPISIEKLTFEAGATGGIGLQINYPYSGFDYRSGPRLYMRDVEFRGAQDASDPTQSSQWFSIDLDLNGVNGARLDNCWWSGSNSGSDNDSEAACTISPLAMQARGPNYPTDLVFNNPTGYYYKLWGDVSGAVEGVSQFGGVFVFCGKVLRWKPDLGLAGRPGGLFIGVHANTFEGIYDFDGVGQIAITDGIFYHAQGAVSDWTGVKLNNCFDVTIRGTKFIRTLASRSGLFGADVGSTTINIYFLNAGTPITLGQQVTGPGIAPNSVITAFGTGTGGAGTYILNNAATGGSGGECSISSAAKTVAVAINGNQTKNIRLDANEFGGAYNDKANPIDIAVTIGAEVPNGQVYITDSNIWSGAYRFAQVVAQRPSQIVWGKGGVIGQLAASQSVASIPSVEVPLIYNSVLYDPFDALNTTTGVITIPKDKGIVGVDILTPTVFDANGTGIRQVAIYRNGTIVAVDNCNATNSATIATSVNAQVTRLAVSGGDQIVVKALQDRGSPLNAQGNLTRIEVSYR